MLTDHLAGIVWSGFMGLVIGNLSTSPIYRLPNHKPLLAEDPYCDTCHARLTTGDLFPVLSWLKSRGKCRHCGAPVPGIYTAVEMATSLLFIISYLKFGFSETFLLVSFGLTALLTLSVMLSQSRFFSDRTFVAFIFCGALWRTLQEGTIYGFAGGAFAGLLIGVLAWKLSGAPMTRESTSYPPYLKLLAGAGVWLALPQLFIVSGAALVASLFVRLRPRLPEWIIAICTALQVLSLCHCYTHLTVSL